MTPEEVRALCAAMGATVMVPRLQNLNHFGCYIIARPYEAFESGATQDEAILNAWDKLMRIMNQ